MSSVPFVSVIIAFYKNPDYLRECVEHCLKLDYPRFEIIIVGNTTSVVAYEKVKWLQIDEVAQGPKKDAGVAHAVGDICAFVDDDAFPRRDWLKNAVKYFEDENVGAVCGPGIAPPNETLMERGGSAVWDSPLGSGPARYRYVPTSMFFVDGEAPGFNLFVRRSLWLKVGGIVSKMRSGEDAILSEKIRRENKKIVYAPDVIVYHRRRPLFVPLLKQVMVYGVHRGFFLRKYPSTSDQGNIVFALPILLIIGFCVGLVLATFGPMHFLQFPILMLLAVCLIVYLVGSFFSGFLVSKVVRVGILTMVGIPLFHLIYSVGYIRGLITDDLGEKPSH